MRPSTICLIAAIVCFIAGAAIFMLALFARAIDPQTGGAIGSILIIAFLALSMVNIALRNRERAEEEK